MRLFNEERSFLGVDAGEGDYDGDSVSFWTSCPFGAGKVPGVTPVRYYFEEGRLYKAVNDREWKVLDEAGGFELSYFDGEEWLEDWSSEETGMLPRAVKASVRIGGEWFSTSFCPGVNKVYRI